MDYSTIKKGSEHRASNGGLDKYYTKQSVAKHISDIVYSRYGDINYVEPTAGNGVFLPYFTTITGYDIYPEHPSIIQKDVFDLMVSEDTVIVGNPPFGTNSQLAKHIINHFAEQKVKAICFILPKTFKKWSKQNDIHLNYHLVYEEMLEKNSFIAGSEIKDVPCVFQIWEYRNFLRKPIQIDYSKYFKFVTGQDNYDIAIRRAGSKAGKVLSNTDSLAEASTYFINCSPRIQNALRNINIEVASYTSGIKSISKPELAYEVAKVLGDI